MDKSNSGVLGPYGWGFSEQTLFSEQASMKLVGPNEKFRASLLMTIQNERRANGCASLLQHRLDIHLGGLLAANPLLPDSSYRRKTEI